MHLALLVHGGTAHLVPYARAVHDQLAAGTALNLNTTGVSTWVKNNILSLVVMASGITILGASRRKDMPGALTMGGIVLLGLAVVGMSTNSFGVGTAIASMFGAA